MALNSKVRALYSLLQSAGLTVAPNSLGKNRSVDVAVLQGFITVAGKRLHRPCNVHVNPAHPNHASIQALLVGAGYKITGTIGGQGSSYGTAFMLEMVA